MSSYRGRATARVRAPDAAGQSSSGAWTLTELGRADSASRAANSAAMAEALAVERQSGFVEGQADGLAAGEARALAMADARLATCRAIAENAARELEATATMATATLEDNVAALAVIVARQIIEREVAADTTLISNIVRRALTEFPVAQALRIRVHPLDLSALSAAPVATPAIPITGTRDVTWLADARMSRGGVLVEGTDRIIDGRIDTALDRAYRRMAGLDAS